MLPWTVQKAILITESPYIYGNYHIYILKLFEVKQDYIKRILISYDFEFEFILKYMFFFNDFSSCKAEEGKKCSMFEKKVHSLPSLRKTYTIDPTWA